MGGDADIGMDADARYGGAAWPAESGPVCHINPGADSGHTPAGARSCGDAPGDRGTVMLRKHRPDALQRVRLLGIGLGSQTPAFEKFF